MKNVSAAFSQRNSVVFLSILWIIAGTACKNNPKPIVAGAATPAAAAAVVTTAAPAVEPGNKADAATILGRKEVPILCYHQIRDYKPADSKTAKAYIIPGARLAEQVKALADSGYHSILPDQLYDYLAYGKALPSKPIMLTFDDTRADQFEIAKPILDKYGYKGVFFIMTVSLGRPGYMTKEQVKQLSDEGHVIGSHTWDHHNVKQYTDPDWITQIEKPSRQLEAITGKHMDYFAYPFGLWNKQAIPHLKDYHFKAAFQLYDKRDENDPLFTIRRIIVPGEWTAEGLQRVMKRDFK